MSHLVSGNVENPAIDQLGNMMRMDWGVWLQYIILRELSGHGIGNMAMTNYIV